MAAAVVVAAAFLLHLLSLQDSNSYYIVVFYNSYVSQWQKPWISPSVKYGGHVEFSKTFAAGTTINNWLVVNAANNNVSTSFIHSTFSLYSLLI